MRQAQAPSQRSLWLPALLLFSIALLPRLAFQTATTAAFDLQADAIEYYAGAYNLYKFGTYATGNIRQLGTPPSPDAARVPGYPLFLAATFPFMKDHHKARFKGVMTVQMVLGALSSALAFLLARGCMPTPWAFLAGLLTACSPHLISQERFFLSENLFLLALLSAALLARRGFADPTPARLILVGAAFGAAALVRPQALLLPPFLALYFLWPGQGWRGVGRAAFILLGLLLIFSPFLVRNKLSLGSSFPEAGRTWTSFVQGTYPYFQFGDALYGSPYQGDPQFPQMRDDRKKGLAIIKDRFLADPGYHLQWWLTGKPLAMWHWDLTPNGFRDVHTYGVTRDGFVEVPWLATLHRVMFTLHGPLLLLAALSGLLWLPSVRRLTGPPPAAATLSALLLLYHLLLLTLLFPLPRYSVPLRPFLYIMALLPLSLLLSPATWRRGPAGAPREGRAGSTHHFS